MSIIHNSPFCVLANNHNFLSRITKTNRAGHYDNNLPYRIHSEFAQLAVAALYPQRQRFVVELEVVTAGTIFGFTSHQRLS